VVFLVVVVVVIVGIVLYQKKITKMPVSSLIELKAKSQKLRATEEEPSKK